ncbi:MAG: hypothetical protein ACPH03_06525 [Flavobacteriaceae bacterium]
MQKIKLQFLMLQANLVLFPLDHLKLKFIGNDALLSSEGSDGIPAPITDEIDRTDFLTFSVELW